MHFIAYSSLWFPFLLHLDWHKLCNMVVLISTPGGQAAGWRDGERSVGSLNYRNWILFIPTEAFESWLCLRACRCVPDRTRAPLTTRLTRRSTDPAGTSVYPKSWPSDWYFHCWYKYHTHRHDTGNLILIVLHSLHWLTHVTCPSFQQIRSHSP